MHSKDLNSYLDQHTHPLSNPLSEIQNKTLEDLEAAHMLSGPQVAALLRLLIRLHQPKKILDLGTFTGFSALTMAEVMPHNSELITCDSLDLHLEIANKNFSLHPKGDKIQVFRGTVNELLDQLKNPVDFVYLDADKKEYFLYYERLIEQLNPKGLLVIDDTLWKGRVVHPEKEREKRMDALNKHILNDPRVENVLLPVRNGVNVIYKL